MSEVVDVVAKEAIRLRGPFVMPFSNVSHLPFTDMLEATRLASFGGLSLRPYDVLAMQEAGSSAATLRRMANDAGIEIARLDPLSAWTAMVSSDSTNLDTPPVSFFQMCQDLGCSYASLNATFPIGHVSFDQVVEDFAKTCDLAAEFGVTCDLENLPMWGVQTWSDAWEIVRQADRPNGGLVFDILHFMRGNSSLSDLQAVPGSRIHTVQLNDGPINLPQGVTLFDNCFDRLWPGEGEFPITEVLQVLERTGGLEQLNPEVFSPLNKELGLSDIAAKSSRTLRDALLKAGIDA